MNHIKRVYLVLEEKPPTTFANHPTPSPSHNYHPGSI